MKSILRLRHILSIALLFWAAIGVAQTDRQFVRNGNKQFRTQNFVKAEAEYRKALSNNPDNPQALYNLGCALLMQKKDSLAMSQFDKAAMVEHSPKRKAMIYHNMGFLFQSHQMYDQAINAYKESLRNNPDDDETRYNLELCKRLNKNSKNNKQKKENKKDNKQNRNKQDKQNESKDNNKQNDKSKSNQQNEKMSKDNAEQLLNAAMQEENATRQRIKDAIRNNKSRKLDKNW